jgi:4-amino-4-deoxy-L-arabinose transferase-like glycosyltransferase
MPYPVDKVPHAHKPDPPRRVTEPTASRSFMPVVLITLAYAALMLPVLWSGQRVNYDGYYTLGRSWGFLATGDWLAVHQNFTPNFKKPPLQYWVTAGLMSTGLPELVALRGFSFVAALWSILLTGALACRLAPDIFLVPSLAALLLCSFRLFASYSVTGMLDVGQGFFVLLVGFAAVSAAEDRRWWLVAGLAAGLGCLQKSPYPLVAYLFLMVFLLAGSRPAHGQSLRERVRDPYILGGLATALVLAFSWPMIQWVRFGGKYWRTAYHHEMILRFTPDIGAPGASIARNVSRLFPSSSVISVASLLALGGGCLLAVFISRRLRTDRRLRGLAILYAATLLAILLAGGRINPRYLLSILPLLATIAGVVIGRLFRFRRVAVVLAALAVMFSVRGVDKVAAGRPSRYSNVREISEKYRGFCRPQDSLVYSTSKHAFPPGAFFRYCSPDRKALVVRKRKRLNVREYAGKRGFEPPYCGLSTEKDLTFLEEGIGPLEILHAAPGVVIWRTEVTTPDSATR